MSILSEQEMESRPSQDALATLGLDRAVETALQVQLCDSWAELEAYGELP